VPPPSDEPLAARLRPGNRHATTRPQRIQSRRRPSRRQPPFRRLSIAASGRRADVQVAASACWRQSCIGGPRRDRAIAFGPTRAPRRSSRAPAARSCFRPRKRTSPRSGIGRSQRTKCKRGGAEAGRDRVRCQAVAAAWSPSRCSRPRAHRASPPPGCLGRHTKDYVRNGRRPGARSGRRECARVRSDTSHARARSASLGELPLVAYSA
jgi:hypothetical protein